MNVAVGERPLLVVIESFGSRAYYEIARNDRFLKKEKKKRREEKETFERIRIEYNLQLFS